MKGADAVTVTCANVIDDTVTDTFVLLVAAEFTVEMVTAGTVAYVPVKV